MRSLNILLGRHCKKSWEALSELFVGTTGLLLVLGVIGFLTAPGEALCSPLGRIMMASFVVVSAISLNFNLYLSNKNKKIKVQLNKRDRFIHEARKDPHSLVLYERVANNCDLLSLMVNTPEFHKDGETDNQRDHVSSN